MYGLLKIYVWPLEGMYLSRIQLVLISNYLDKEYAMNLSHGVVHRLKSVWHVIDQTSANFSSPPRSYNLGIEGVNSKFECSEQSYI